MKGKHVILALALIALPAAARAQTGSCTVTIDPDSTVLPYDATGGSFPVEDDAACFWKVTGVVQNGTWLTLHDYTWSISGDSGVNYSVTPNTGPERTATIAIDAYGDYTVVQEAQPCGVFRSDNALTGSPIEGVYVANTDCGRVVNVYNGGDGWGPVLTKEGSQYEGLVYGPDALLYALDPTANTIVRFAAGDLEPSDVHSFAPPARPRLAAFNNRGDLIVVDDADGAGLRFLHNLNPIGDDLAFDPDADLIPGSFDLGHFSDVITLANGDLLAATSAGNVYRFPFTPAASPPYLSHVTVATITGGASAIARAANGTVFIATGNTINTYTFDDYGDLVALESSCTTFGDATTIADIDVSADDSLYVTTLTTDAFTKEKQGDLWEIRYYDNDTHEFGCQAKSPLATFAPPSPTDGDTPLVGVAVPFTTRDGKDNPTVEGAPVGSQLFNFFDSLYEFRAIDNDQCLVTVSDEEFSPSIVQDLIETMPPGTPVAHPITFFGDNGRAIGYHYEQVGTSCTGNAVDTTVYEHAINAYYSAFKPQIMRCEDPDGAAPGCELIALQSYYPDNGFFPDDGRVGGTNPSFSTTFLVDVATEDTTYTYHFCGFQSPLTAAIPADEATIPPWNDASVPVFQTGSDVPVKFTVAVPDGTCAKGPFETQTIVAVMWLTKVRDSTGEEVWVPIPDVDITGGGSAETGRIVFDNPDNKNKPFALQVKLSQDGADLDPGMYEVTVTDDTAATNGTSTFYFNNQKVYFKVK